MELPVFDISPFLASTEHTASAPGGTSPDPRVRDLCVQVAECLRTAGALVLRDPRCSARDNERFLDMMEKYFGQADHLKQQQARPDYHYQVGVTPEGVEVPRAAVDAELQEEIARQPAEHRARLPRGADPKWRYMWRVGPRPSSTQFAELNADPVVPSGFPEWAAVMDGWGFKMIAAVEAVAQMAALGFSLQRDSFTALMDKGPHLLAPTGSDLAAHGRPGAVFAGYHYDLNFLTIHGRSRFPGLHIWLRDGRKVQVSVPDGCLLVQSGKQLEWLTGGECRAGMHEVVVTERTEAAMDRARLEGRSLWRVSSTVFGHIASDALLQPLGRFAGAPRAADYPPILAGTFVERELSAIQLKRRSATGAEREGEERAQSSRSTRLHSSGSIVVS